MPKLLHEQHDVLQQLFIKPIVIVSPRWKWAIIIKATN